MKPNARFFEKKDKNKKKTTARVVWTLKYQATSTDLIIHDEFPGTNLWN